MKLSYRFNHPKNSWRIDEDINHVLHDKTTIIIPKGFLTDGSSSPFYLRWLFPRVGDFFLAAIVHDYLYRTMDLRGKSFADKEMLIVSNKMNKNKIDNYCRFAAVVIFGKRKAELYEL